MHGRVKWWKCASLSVWKEFCCWNVHLQFKSLHNLLHGIVRLKKTKQKELSDHCVPHFTQFLRMSCVTPSFYQSGRQFPFFHTNAFGIKQSLKKTQQQQMPEPWRDEWKLFPSANFCVTFKGEHLDKDKSWNMATSQLTSPSPWYQLLSFRLLVLFLLLLFFYKILLHFNNTTLLLLHT